MININYAELPSRDVLCIDCKSFFASVEAVKRKINPLKAYIVVMSNADREGGLVLAASPLVKKEYGIKTGSRRYQIPYRSKIQVVPPAMGDYVRMNLLINNIYKRYTDDLNWFPYSIDESFIDVTGSHTLFGTNIEIAKQIQKEVWSKLGIYVTIGIGRNPLLAKLAMDIEAKHTRCGIAEWTYDDVPKIWTIPKLEDMWGIGAKTADKLRLLGIRNVKELANSTPEKMKKHFGIIGLQLFYHAHGVDYSILSERVIPKSTSIGNSQILPKDYYQPSQVEVVLREMVEKLAKRLRSQKKLTACVHVTIRYSKHEKAKGFSKQRKITATNRSDILAYEIINLFRTSYRDYAVRQIGVSLAQLQKEEGIQLNLFENSEKQVRSIQLNHITDKIQQRYGFTGLMKASSLLEGATGKDRSELLGGHKK